jgi:hypothetical protein
LEDAPLLKPGIRSFPELSLSLAFRRKRSSAYAAIEGGEQNQVWLKAHFVQQLPKQESQTFSLDDTAWLHPAAKTLANRQYICSSN